MDRTKVKMNDSARILPGNRTDQSVIKKRRGTIAGLGGGAGPSALMAREMSALAIGKAWCGYTTGEGEVGHHIRINNTKFGCVQMTQPTSRYERSCTHCAQPIAKARARDHTYPHRVASSHCVSVAMPS